MAAFAWKILHFPQPAALVEYLATLPRPPWLRRLILHCTAGPSVAQWQAAGGKRAMENLRNFYRDTKGWPSGPHLFVGPDGIWQGTPLTQPGTHANAANPDSTGIEIVGFYDTEFWQEPIRSYAYGTLRALCVWGKLPASAILPHRDFNPDKTCPGRAINMATVRAEVARLLRDGPLVPPPPPDPWARWGTSYPLPESVRGFGLPQLWLKYPILGAATSPFLYNSTRWEFVTFERGIIVWEQDTDRGNVYRVPVTP